MLREITQLTQHAGAATRRWFTSPYFDLTVQYGCDGEISGFELCYGKPDAEKAIVWSAEHGYTHQNVDSGESEPLKYKMTPIYLPDGLFDSGAVAERFVEESGAIDPSLREYVVDRLHAYTRRSG